MKNNLFEKQVSEKLNQYQVSPSRDLFDDIMQQRTPQVKKVFWTTWRVFSAFFITAAVSVAVYQLLPTQNQKVAQIREKINTNLKNEPVEDKGKLEVKSASSLAQNKDNVYVKSKLDFDNRVNSKLSAKTPKNVKANSSKTISQNILFQDNVFENYFNANSKNRPLIEFESHNGNSHLYGFITENEKDVDKVLVNHMKNKLFVRFSNHSPEINLSKVEQQRVEKNNRVSKKPYHIDVFQLSSISKPIISNSQIQLQNMGLLAINSTSFGWGVNAELPIKGKWSLFSGVHSFNLNNQYKGLIEYSESEEKITKKTRFINDPIKGVIAIESFDTSMVLVSKNRNIEIKNSYKLVQIPLGVSYNFGYKSFDFSLNAAAMFNWSREQSYQYVNWKNDQIEKVNSSNNLFSLGVNAGLKVFYPLSNHFKVFVMPGLQTYSMNGVKSSYTHNESVVAKQVQLGVRYSVF